jgi:hypothetical protein
MIAGAACPARGTPDTQLPVGIVVAWYRLAIGNSIRCEAAARGVGTLAKPRTSTARIDI